LEIGSLFNEQVRTKERNNDNGGGSRDTGVIPDISNLVSTANGYLRPDQCDAT
jgi:hypothetical protein